MYTIGNVVFGVPVRMDKLPKEISENDDELDKLGIVREYSGSTTYVPAWCGVKLFEIDECADVNMSDLLRKIGGKTLPASKQEEIEDKISKLPPEAVVGKLDHWIVWSSS